MNKNKQIVTIILIITVLLIVVLNKGVQIFRQNHLSLSEKIVNNLEKEYNTKFICESLDVYGGGVDFICYPVNDPSLHFGGFGDSETGVIIRETYPGAIIAREDSRFLTEQINGRLGEFFVYGVPVVEGNNVFAEILNDNVISVDELRKHAYLPNRYFYIIINMSNNHFLGNSRSEYDILASSVNALVEMYKECYGREIYSDLQVFYLDDSDYEQAKNHFNTHVSSDDDQGFVFNPNNQIIIEMGSENVQGIHKNLRLSIEEFIEARERIK